MGQFAEALTQLRSEVANKPSNGKSKTDLQNEIAILQQVLLAWSIADTDPDESRRHLQQVEDLGKEPVPGIPETEFERRILLWQLKVHFKLRDFREVFRFPKSHPVLAEGYESTGEFLIQTADQFDPLAVEQWLDQLRDKRAYRDLAWPALVQFWHNRSLTDSLLEDYDQRGLCADQAWAVGNSLMRKHRFNDALQVFSELANLSPQQTAEALAGAGRFEELREFCRDNEIDTVYTESLPLKCWSIARRQLPTGATPAINNRQPFSCRLVTDSPWDLDQADFQRAVQQILPKISGLSAEEIRSVPPPALKISTPGSLSGDGSPEIQVENPAPPTTHSFVVAPWRFNFVVVEQPLAGDLLYLWNQETRGQIFASNHQLIVQVDIAADQWDFFAQQLENGQDWTSPTQIVREVALALSEDLPPNRQTLVLESHALQTLPAARARWAADRDPNFYDTTGNQEYFYETNHRSRDMVEAYAARRQTRTRFLDWMEQTNRNAQSNPTCEVRVEFHGLEEWLPAELAIDAIDRSGSRSDILESINYWVPVRLKSASRINGMCTENRLFQANWLEVRHVEFPN